MARKKSTRRKRAPRAGRTAAGRIKKGFRISASGRVVKARRRSPARKRRRR